MTYVSAVAQQVTFASPEFEIGVKVHLDLGSADIVQQAQLDTITAIDLSGFGISDIRDVVYLPNVRNLNLGYNNITDISPVVSLDSLHYLDLRANKLDNIDILSMASSDSMVVNVAYNYIMDFGRMLLPSQCYFTFIGSGAQIDLSQAYLDIYQLFAGFEEEQQCVNYRALSNLPSVTLVCGGNAMEAPIDGWQSILVPKDFSTTTKVYLTDGIRSDSTWVIPLQRLTVGGGEEISIETGLPDDYSISFANANHGTVTLAGLTVTYQAPAVAVPDTISLSYYQGRKLRGQARYLINSVLLGDVNGEGRVDEVDAQQILDVSAGVKSLGGLTVPEAVGVPGGSSNALEVNAQKVLDYSVAGDKPW